MRLRGDTLRLRLTRSETDALGQGQPVAEQTPFPDGTALRYELVPVSSASPDARQVQDDGVHTVRIEIGAERAHEWALSDETGFSGDAPFQTGPLAVLIEKDFSCINPRDGDEELDTFPNPNV